MQRFSPSDYNSPAEEDVLSKEELDSIRRGMEDVKMGRVYRMMPGESLDEFLDRIGCDLLDLKD